MFLNLQEYIRKMYVFICLFVSSNSPRLCLNIEDDPDIHGKPFLSSSAPPLTSLSLLGNFEVMISDYSES